MVRAVALAGDDRDLGTRCLSVGKEQLCSMLDNPMMLLSDAGKKAGNVDKGEDRNIKGIAEADKARAFLGAVDVEDACKDHWLVGDDADGTPFDTAKADDDVRCMGRHQLEEVALVGDLPNKLVHVIGGGRAWRHERVEAFLNTVDRIFARPLGQVMAGR